MRNLKKILALVLALVMSMSLLATANAFEDNDKINETYKVAADVLSGLKVFQGRPDGNFDPKAGITRAEVAAIIYRIVSKDVTDAQKNIYSDYNRFSDVNSGSWYAGYVNFCANGEYIKGYPDGKFGPNDPVTGYQALAMILRAIGYDKNGEFTGTGWEVRTATVAKQLGITNNITEGTLRGAATREAVAEILFRALLVPTVSYYPALGYQPNKTSLGFDNFKLAAFEGVVTANEYADLNSDSALAEGKTEIDGTVYNCVTKLTDIGENRFGYAAGKDVLYIEDKGNEVFETGAATKITKANVGMSVNDAEYFLNFGGEDGVYESDYRLEYVIEGLKFTATVGEGKGEYDDADAAKAAVKAFFDEYGVEVEDSDIAEDGNNYSYSTNIEKVIKVGAKFDDTDIACMKLIFTEADKENESSFELGEVYVGTKSTEDISDEISWKEFQKKYVTSLTDYVEFDKSVNGDWLKVIDNDGDGEAEYVFKTEFVMEQVINLTKKGVLTLTNDTKFGGAYLPYVTASELAVGDVVLYAIIDGVAFVEEAPSFTGEVDKYTYKTKTLTVDGEDYTESEIAEHTGYENVLENADKKTEYTYFQDWFGFIRVFAAPAEAEGNLLLMTDAFYRNNKLDDEAAVKAYLNDELGVHDVDPDELGGFFKKNAGDNNDWGKLNTFAGDAGVASDKKAWTNVGRYTEKDGLLSLETAKTYTYDKKGKVDGIKTDYVDLDEQTFAAGQSSFAGEYSIADGDEEYGITANNVHVGEDIDVQANKNTVFYYVSKLGTKYVVDTVVVGYKNTIAVTSEDNINAMYAVATNAHQSAGDLVYWVADVIVIETEEPVVAISKDVVLTYNVDNKTYKDFAGASALDNKAEDVKLQVISYNGDDYDNFKPAQIVNPWFYTNSVDKNGDSYLRQITGNYAEYGIYAHKIQRLELLEDEYFVADNGDTVEFNAEKLPVWDIVEKKLYNALDNDDGDLTLKAGESYIFYAVKGKAVYAIHVDTEKTTSDTYKLFDAIVTYQDADPQTEVAEATALLNKFSTVDASNYEEAKAAVNNADINALKPSDAKDAAEWDAFRTALETAKDAVAAFEANDKPLIDAKAKGLAIIKANVANDTQDENFTADWSIWKTGEWSGLIEAAENFVNNCTVAADAKDATKIKAAADVVYSAMDSAINSLKTDYPNSNYSDLARWEKVDAILKATETKIKAASSAEAVQAVVAAAKEELNTIDTDPVKEGKEKLQRAKTKLEKANVKASSFSKTDVETAIKAAFTSPDALSISAEVGATAGSEARVTVTLDLNPQVPGVAPVVVEIIVTK